MAEARGAQRALRRQRADIAFGLDGGPWNEDMVLQRYELLYEAGLVQEAAHRVHGRSEEHTSELQSPCNLVCRLLLEKKNNEYNRLGHSLRVRCPFPRRRDD